ncbi:flagellin [Lysobacteraceae bacterium NML93-0792]|nr:flagellin [Xanthomonadaceae bacterium NML93-0792]PBS16016.1 flagellin [Xanthomonadaceae bacterium NML93-0793]PBS19007.1 flagellin [Xanthomonadaceae bacterium NML93-0831]
MMSVINTNTISLNAQRNLATNSASLSTSIQRLSSGQRINSAKDDAAGLAISERFTTQIRGMNQAARNANDGISLAQTAEGALGEIGNNLQRIRELAVQSRNATNSDSDRIALNAEVTQLKAEIQRVSEQTSFNDKKLLDGSFTAQAFQVGANQGQTITIDSIANASTAALGEWESTVEATVTGAAVTAGTVSGLTINGQAVADVTVTADASGAQALAAAINAALTAGNVTNVVASTNDDAVVLTASDGADIEVGGTVANSGLTLGTESATTADEVGFTDENVLTAEAADRMILAMDAALGAVNSSRADLGAVQNRFSSVVANLQTSSENLSASRSRIMDTDFAKETAELSRTQVLQQAGTAMLAQANQLPNNVLSLLR